MATFPEAEARLFGKFVCRKCETQQKGTMAEYLRKEMKCRKCKSLFMRPQRRRDKK